MEESILWDTNGVGDGAADITRAQWIDFYRMLFLRDYTTQGVAPGYLNALAVSSTGNNNVRVASGGAVVRGFLYQSTANVDHTVSSPVADTGFRVVLRVDWDAQTVRSDVVMNTTGVTDPPALTQVEGDEWEISLATGTITSGGVISVTSSPTYLYYNTKVSTAMVDDAAITAAKLAAAVAGNGLAGGAGSALSVTVDDSTIEINSDTLRVKDLGVVTAKIDNLAVTSGKLGAASVLAAKIGVGAVKFEKRRGDSNTDWSSGSTSGNPAQQNYTLANPVKMFVICQDLQIPSSSTSATTTAEYPDTYTNPPACLISLVNDDLDEGVFLEARPESGNETVRASVIARRGNPGDTSQSLNLTFMLLVIGE
jgi:hypothetical protein